MRTPNSGSWARCKPSRNRSATRPLVSPPIAQLAQTHEHAASVGVLGEIGEFLTQARDHLRTLQPQEGVDSLFLPQGGDARRGGLRRACAGEELGGILVAWLAVERELEIARQVLMPRTHLRALGQPRELRDEGVVERFGLAAVVAVAGTGVEQRVAAEERRRLGVRQQAHVRHGMARRVQALELDAAPDTDEVALRESPVHAADAVRGAGVRQDLRAGCGLEALVSAGVILVLVCVDDLRDLPAAPLRGGKAQLPLERIDRQRLSA